MKDINYIIADNMKIYRKNRNLTQAELAEKAELSIDSIKRLEGGKRSMSLENFLRVADALQIPLSFCCMKIRMQYQKWNKSLIF